MIGSRDSYGFDNPMFCMTCGSKTDELTDRDECNGCDIESQVYIEKCFECKKNIISHEDDFDKTLNEMKTNNPLIYICIDCKDKL